MEVMPTFSAESMLEHSAWLRRLALSLVRDPELAEDLLQDTWVRALENPPAGAGRGSVRAWLGTVLRNLARRRWQHNAIRERWRSLGGDEEPGATTDDLFAFQRELLNAVDKLEPHQRQAILLRYFEDLPPRKIAARLGLPVKTVNSRISRALLRLRAPLDASYNGERRTWVLCVLPLLAKPPARLALATGTLIMGLKISIALLATSLLCFIGWRSLRSEAQERPGAEQSLESPASLELASEAAPSALALAEEPARQDVAPRPDAQHAPPTELLKGLAVLSDGTPCALLPIKYVPREAARHAQVVQLRTDALGRFALKAEYPGKIMSDDPQFTDLIIPDHWTADKAPVTLVVAPNGPFSGVCINPSGAFIEGVNMRMLLPAELHARTGVIFESNTSFASFYAKSGKDGAFHFAPLPVVAGSMIEFDHPDHEPLSLPAPGHAVSNQEVILIPKTLGDEVLSGVVLDPEGQVLRGAQVALGETLTESDAAGQFQFHLSEVEQPERIMALYPGFAPKIQKGLKTASGWSWPEFIELQFTGAPARIQGSVLDAEGLPVAGAKVWIENPTRMGYNGDFPVHVERELLQVQLLWVSVLSDHKGRFEHGGLMDQEYAMRAGHPSSGEFSDVVRAFPGGDALLKFKPDATTALEGQVLDQSGEAVPGARVHVDRLAHTLTDKKGDSYQSQLRGESTVTDEEGRFRIESVAREGCDLHVSGKGIVQFEMPLSLGLHPDPLQLVVDMQCQLRIEIQSADLDLDAVKLLDQDGKALPLRRSVRDAVYISPTAPLPEGVQTLLVPQSAVSAVFLKGELEVLRLPLKLSAIEINYLRP